MPRAPASVAASRAAHSALRQHRAGPQEHPVYEELSSEHSLEIVSDGAFHCVRNNIPDMLNVQDRLDLVRQSFGTRRGANIPPTPVHIIGACLMNDVGFEGMRSNAPLLKQVSKDIVSFCKYFFDSQKSGAAKAQAQSSSTLQTAQDQSSSSLQADTGAKRGSNSTEAPSLAKRQKDNSGRPSTSRSRSRQPPTTPTAPATPTTSKGKGKDKSNTQAKKPQKATEPAAEKQSVSRNATQKKRARIRDGMACVITGFCDPHVTYIIPFSWVQDTDNIKKTEEASDGMYHILGEETYNRIADVVFELGGVDGTWNMISLNAVMHFWWAQARWGFEPVGVTEVDGRYRVEMIFRWMYRETAEFAEKEMDLDEGEDDLQELLARVQSWEGGEDEAGRPQGPVQSKGAGIGKFGMHHVDGPSIRSGRRIFILHDTRADAEKAMIVLKIQWACIRLMAISGAAELWKRDWDYEERCRRIRQQETEQHNEDMPRGRTRKRTGSWPEVAPEGPGSVSSTLSLPLRPLNPQPTPDPKRGYSQS